MMGPIQLRMARAALGLTLKDLAERAGVNMNTVARYEAGQEILTGTMQKIEDVLRREGVVFVEEDDSFWPSIRVRKLPMFVADIQEEQPSWPRPRQSTGRPRQKKRK